MPNIYVFYNFVARPEGLEPPAYWFEANRSIQLSYGRANQLRTNPSTSARSFCVQLDPVHVLHGLQIEANHIADLDELRHHHPDAVLEFRGLRRAVLLLLRRCSGLLDLHLDVVRE